MRFTTLLLAAVAKCETMMDYLLGDNTAPELSLSSALAKKMDRGRLVNLLAEAKGGLVLVLPTDDAWRENMDLYNILNDTTVTANKFRTDLMLAAGGEIDEVGGFDVLLSYANRNDGVVDTAYGTPIKIASNGNVCIVQYDQDWELKIVECAKLQLPPMVFDDGALYLIDHIIIPEELNSEIHAHHVGYE